MVLFMPQIRPQINAAILFQYQEKSKVIKHFPNIYIKHVRLCTHHNNQTNRLWQHEVWIPQELLSPFKVGSNTTVISYVPLGTERSMSV